jgi:hypothetical protein
MAERLADAIDTGSAEQTQLCPECGQPLALSRPALRRRDAIPWRSIFVAVFGLYLAITFARAAWHSSQRASALIACPPAETSQVCVALPHDLSLQIASRRLSTEEAVAARTAELEVGRDLRNAAIGLGGVVLVLATALVRLTRQRRWPALVSEVGSAMEGAVAVFYGEMIVVGVYRLIDDTPANAPIALSRFGDSLYRALSMIFALVGAQ